MKLSVDKLDIEIARKKLSINELCEKSGLPRTTVGQARRGARNVKPQTIGRLAEALGVDVTEIIEGTAIPETNK